MAEPPTYKPRDHEGNEKQHGQDNHGDSVERNTCLRRGNVSVGSYLRKMRIENDQIRNV